MTEIYFHAFSSTTPNGFCKLSWLTTRPVLRSSEVNSMAREGLNRTRDLNSLFHDHAKHWKREVAYISSSTLRHKNEHYQAIIKMGLNAVPLILKVLEKAPADWFFALHEITGEDPVDEVDFGDFRKMSDKWLTWGRQRGYLRK